MRRSWQELASASHARGRTCAGRARGGSRRPSLTCGAPVARAALRVRFEVIDEARNVRDVELAARVRVDAAHARTDDAAEVRHLEGVIVEQARLHERAGHVVRVEVIADEIRVAAAAVRLT